MLFALSRTIVIAALLATVSACVQHQIGTRPEWVASWAASPQAASTPATNSIRNQTIRQIVHLSGGGVRVRIRFSNEFGTRPLRIGAVAVALSDAAARIEPATSRAVTFGGHASVVIAPGTPMMSDPVALEVAPFSDLAISVYLADDTQPETIHEEGLQTAYLSAAGNVVDDTDIANAATSMQRFFLTSVEVQSPDTAGTIAILGDSITDGGRSSANFNRRWPDLLARRLGAQSGRLPTLSVANAGIAGNALLHSAVYGGSANSNVSALARFDRDVNALAGVRQLIVLEGVNDLDSMGLRINGRAVEAPPVTADDLIRGYQQIIARAHAHAIRVIGGTIMPFEHEGVAVGEGAPLENAWTPEKEAIRQAVNHWIISSHAFDGVVNFDALVRDPSDPSTLSPAYDSGDHIHPNDLGNAAMANGIDLSLFR